MNKEIIKGSMVVGLLWLFMINPVWGIDYGYIHKRVITKSPSHLKPNKPKLKLVAISCHDAWTGSLLDCEFTHRVIGLKEPKEDIVNNGGHIHDYDTHPLIDPKDGELEFSGNVLERGKLWIKGRTGDYIAVIGHQMPEVAGKIVIETTITAPPGWYCASGCFTKKTSKFEDTLDVGVKGLGRLSDPVPNEHYFKLRGGMDTHPEGHWGTGDTIKKLKEIAEEYYKRSGIILSINDISLPRGGLFDYEGTWEPPHSSHRTGTDADINRLGIDCNEDDKLERAVEKVAGGKSRPRLRCYPDGRQHIDFD